MHIKQTLKIYLLLVFWACSYGNVGLADTTQSRCTLVNQGSADDPNLPDTDRIQALIDRCAGKRAVRIPEGEWLTGRLQLRSGLEFELKEGAILRLVPDINAFPEWQDQQQSKSQSATGGANEPKRVHRTAIYGKDVKNVTITGKGVIDGSGESFWDEDFYNLNIPRPTLPRPAPTLGFNNAQNISLSGITLRNLAAYAVSFRNSQNVKVSDIKISNDRRSPNTDGIQIRDSTDVMIDGVDIRTGDDAIVLKSRHKIISNVIVKNSYLESDDGAIKFGTGSHVGVHNSRFENIEIANSRYGIAIFTIDGGQHLNNVFEDIRITTGGRYGRHYPIFIDVDRRKADRAFGSVDGITFRNIDIVSSGASLIAGNAKGKLRNIRFENMRLKHANNIYDLQNSKGKPRGNVMIKPQAHSEDYGKLQADFVIANVDGLTFKNSTISEDNLASRAQVMLVEATKVKGTEQFKSVIKMTRAQAKCKIDASLCED